MKLNQLKTGVVLAYVSQLIHVLSGLLYTPVMLRLLGQSEYGLYQLVASVISYLGILNFGFNGAYMRFYSRYKVKNDEDSIAKLNGMFMMIFALISIICVIFGGIMVINADKIFGSGLTQSELSKSRVLMTILVINMAVTFITTVFTCNETAHEKFIFQRLITLLSTILNPFLTLPLLIAGYGSVGMVGVSVCLTIFNLFLNILYCRKKLNMKFTFKVFDVELLKDMFGFTFFIFLNTIIDQINWNVDKMLLGRMVGTVSVAIYGVAAQLNTMYMSISTTINGVFVLRVNMMVAKHNKDGEITELFTKVGRIQFILCALVMSVYVLFGKEFIEVWAGTGYLESYYVGLFLMLPLTVPLIQNIGIEIQRAKNKHKVRTVVYTVITIANIFVSIWCINRWGTTGAAIGTALSLLLGNGIFMNFYYHKKIGLNTIYFWKEIIKLMPTIFLCSVVGIILRFILPLDNNIILFVAIFIYICVYIILMFNIGMNDSEKNLIKKPLERLGIKLCKK